MNSLLGNLGRMFMNGAQPPQNNITNTIKPTQQSTPNLLMQAIGAAMRGESPQTFMQNLAQTHPQLRQYDLSNLQQTAQQVCQQNGVDMQQAINQMDNIVDSIRQ